MNWNICIHMTINTSTRLHIKVAMNLNLNTNMHVDRQID